jgi:transcription initiation factor IIE alpha subunit
MSNNLYFCGVKSEVRYEAAAQMQRFLCPNCIIKNKRNVCGSSNARKASALLSLTARIALSLFNV